MRNQGIFLVFILSLTMGLQFAYGLFRDHYSGEKDLRARVIQLGEEKERQALQQALLQSQVEDMRAGVYETLGQKKSLAWNEKQWWAAMRGPASIAPIQPRSGSLLAGAKESFRERNYAESTEKLKLLIRDYPVSKDIVEAHFLLAESLYLSGQAEASLDLIDQMMTRYPESELTGFIMLRMGQILQKRNRPLEAKEVYETVLKRFPQSAELKNQAEKMMKGISKS